MIPNHHAASRGSSSPVFHEGCSESGKAGARFHDTNCYHTHLLMVGGRLTWCGDLREDRQGHCEHVRHIKGLWWQIRLRRAGSRGGWTSWNVSSWIPQRFPAHLKNRPFRLSLWEKASASFQENGGRFTGKHVHQRWNNNHKHLDEGLLA